MKITDEQQKKIIEFYRHGKSSIEIAKLYNVSKTTILEVLHNNGESMRIPNLKKLDKTQQRYIIELYISGKSIKEIAECCQKSRSCILRTLKRNDIKIRGSTQRVKIIDNMCICKICNKVKPVSEMRKDKNTPTGISRICNQCSNEKHKKSDTVYKKYGINQKTYEDILRTQNGKCAICGCDTGGTSRSGNIKKLSVDHDHDTGKVRGLLCNMCNVGIGNLRDSPELLEKAAKYLRSYT